MTEIKWFRLLLVGVAALVLSAGSVWCYSKLSAMSSWKDAERWGKVSSEAQDHCFQNNPGASATYCVNEGYSNRVRRHVETAQEYEERADTALWFLSLPPFVLIVAFYALRWALCGRLKPFWLLGQ